MPRHIVIAAAFAILIVALIVGAWPSHEPTLTPLRADRIAFMSDRGGTYDVYLLDLESGELTDLTNDQANDGLPSWNDRANAFVFLTTRGTDTVGIYRMDIDGANAAPIRMDPPADADPPIWSPTGEWLAFAGLAESNAEIYIVDSNGSGLRNITNHPAADRFGAWSPDGQKVAFVSDRDGAIGIYSIDLQGGEATLLSDPESPSGGPSWSPDGTQLAFMSSSLGDVEIYVMDSDGGNIVRLTESVGFDGFPTWSPDGTRIAFLSNRDGNPEIYVMNADGSAQTNLTNHPAQESVQGDFAWSPDGRQILFHSDRDGNPDVFVMDADGSNPTNLTVHAATDLGAIWVP